MLITFLIIFVIIITSVDLTKESGNGVKAIELEVNSITEGSFKIGWCTQESDPEYTVILNVPIEGCNSTEYVVRGCSFVLSDYCNPTSPCTDVNVQVKKGETFSDQLQFKTAPRVTELINMECALDETHATVIWDSEIDSQDSSCATRAKVKVAIDGSTSGIPIMAETTLGQTNNISIKLDPCKPGKVDCYVVYVTGNSEYETGARHHTRSEDDYQGVGVDDLMIEQSDDWCSILVSWHSVCSDIDDYQLTLDDGLPIHTSDTQYTVVGLEPGNHTVCVEAYADKSPIGDIFCDDTYWEQECITTTEATTSTLRTTSTIATTSTTRTTTTVATTPVVTTTSTASTISTAETSSTVETTSTMAATTLPLKPSTDLELFEETLVVLESIQRSYIDLLDYTAYIMTNTKSKSEAKLTTGHMNATFKLTHTTDVNCHEMCQKIIATMDRIQDITVGIDEWTLQDNKHTELNGESTILNKQVEDAKLDEDFKDDADYIHNIVAENKEDLDATIDYVEKLIDDMKSPGPDMVILVVVGAVGGLIGALLVVLIGLSIYAYISKGKKNGAVGLDGPAGNTPLVDLDKPRETRNSNVYSEPRGLNRSHSILAQQYPTTTANNFSKEVSSL